MHSYHIFWEDQERNREVEIFVDYKLEGGVVHLDRVRPTRVTLYDAETQQVSRTLGVFTAAGRRLLAGLYQGSRFGLPRLEEEIFAHHHRSESKHGDSVKA
jgi:hypothetical protein